jgi:hypothetical protein
MLSRYEVSWLMNLGMRNSHCRPLRHICVYVIDFLKMMGSEEQEVVYDVSLVLGVERGARSASLQLVVMIESGVMMVLHHASPLGQVQE